MKEKSIASRYAKALFDLAEERNSLEAYGKDWQYIADTLSEHEEARALFETRLLSREDKKSLAKNLFSAHCDPLVLNFLFLLLDKGREKYLNDILEAFIDLVNKKNGVLVVKVAAAALPDEKQQAELIAALAKTTGKTIKLDLTVNRDLIGGMIITVDGKVYDGSITGQLSLLKQHLSAGSDKN